MSLHNLKPAKGSVHKKKRLGRGQGSGKAGTSGRGHKGAQSRSGYKVKRNFEGGQMPFQMRVPKRGFNNPNRIAYVPFNLYRLQEIADKYGISDLSIEKLREHRLLRRNDRLKILGSGEISSAIRVEAHAASDSAQQAIAAAGGSITIV